MGVLTSHICAEFAQWGGVGPSRREEAMKLFSALTSAFGKKKINLESRFEFSSKWIQGSTGRVHIVRQKSDGQTFALKIVDPKKQEQFRGRFAAKFETEPEVALSMQHENIVQTAEIGCTHKGNDFILMEFIKGPLLERLLVEKPAIVRSNVLTYIKQIAAALLHVHEAGYIHRDFCPRNILVGGDGKTLKLFDFGITVPDKEEFRQPKNRTGTPLFMAPEIVRRRETDHTVDIFAFGITVYQILTLKHPWGVEENSSKSALLFDSRPATDIRQHIPKLDNNVADAVMSCLEVDRKKRCGSIKRFMIQMGLR